MTSVLEYAVSLLFGLPNIEAEKLEKLVNRFDRLLCGNHIKIECMTLLEDRRKLHVVTLYVTDQVIFE